MAQGMVMAAHKEKSNTYYRSSYADLASCWDACREALSKHGLAVVQLPQLVSGRLSLVTMLMHSSGEWVKSVMPIKPMQQVKGEGWVDTPNPQAVGSAITYARRYALAAMVGIAPSDDDGNAASGRGGQGYRAPHNKPIGRDEQLPEKPKRKPPTGKPNKEPPADAPPTRSKMTKKKTAKSGHGSGTPKSPSKPADVRQEPAHGDLTEDDPISQAQRARLYAHASELVGREHAGRFLHFIIQKKWRPDVHMDTVSVTKATKRQGSELVDILNDPDRRFNAVQGFAAETGTVVSYPPPEDKEKPRGRAAAPEDSDQSALEM